MDSNKYTHTHTHKNGQWENGRVREEIKERKPSAHVHKNNKSMVITDFIGY